MGRVDGRDARVDPSIRRFLGWLTEALPHHVTLVTRSACASRNSSVFEQQFTQVLASCRDAGLPASPSVSAKAISCQDRPWA